MTEQFLPFIGRCSEAGEYTESTWFSGIWLTMALLGVVAPGSFPQVCHDLNQAGRDLNRRSGVTQRPLGLC